MAAAGCSSSRTARSGWSTASRVGERNLQVAVRNIARAAGRRRLRREAHPGCAAAGRVARGGGVAAVQSGRHHADDSPIPESLLHGQRARPRRDADLRHGGHPVSRHRAAREHPDQRRHEHRQDDVAECARRVSAGRRPRRAHRGHRRTAAGQAEPRALRGAARAARRAGGHDSRPPASHPAASSRSHHRRRGARRGSVRPAPGAEHRPLAARCPRSTRTRRSRPWRASRPACCSPAWSCRIRPCGT